MLTMSLVVTLFTAFVVLEVVMWSVRLVFRLLGWTLKAGFWLMGLLLSPVWLVLVVVFGIASVGWTLLPLILVAAFISGLFSED